MGKRENQTPDQKFGKVDRRQKSENGAKENEAEEGGEDMGVYICPSCGTKGKERHNTYIQAETPSLYGDVKNKGFGAVICDFLFDIDRGDNFCIFLFSLLLIRG